MTKYIALFILITLSSCQVNRVVILDHRIVEKRKIISLYPKQDTIRMITLETGEVITHKELNNRFKRSIKEMRKVN